MCLFYGTIWIFLCYYLSFIVFHSPLFTSSPFHFFFSFLLDPNTDKNDGEKPIHLAIKTVSKTNLEKFERSEQRDGFEERKKIFEYLLSVPGNFYFLFFFIFHF